MLSPPRRRLSAGCWVLSPPGRAGNRHADPLPRTHAAQGPFSNPDRVPGPGADAPSPRRREPPSPLSVRDPRDPGTAAAPAESRVPSADVSDSTRGTGRGQGRETEAADRKGG